MSKISYTVNNIIDAVSEPYYKRGLSYYKKGNVSKVNFRDGELRGNVIGTKIYFLRILIKGSKIEGRCSCPMAYNCKHVAAVLLAAMNSVFVDYANETTYMKNADDTDNIKNNNNNQNNNVFSLPANKTNSSTAIVQDIKKTTEIIPAVSSDFIKDYRTKLWLDNIEALVGNVSQKNQSELNSANNQVDNKELVYILELENQIIKIFPYIASFKKDGSYSKTTKLYNIDNGNARREVPKCIDMENQFILHRILKDKDSNRYLNRGYEIVSADLLERIIATGKCQFKKIGGIVLSIGESKKASFGWNMLNDGKQVITCNTDNESDYIIKLNTIYYLNEEAGVCGKLNTDMNHNIVNTLLSAPALNPTEVDIVRKKLKQYAKEVAIPIPSDFKKVEVINGVPIPHLYLYGHDIKYNYYDNMSYLGLAQISFYYNDTQVAYNETKDSFNIVKDGALIRYKRDIQKENDFVNLLCSKYYLESVKDYQYHYHINGDVRSIFSICIEDLDVEDADLEEKWIDFVTHVVPQMRKDGWMIEIDESFPYNITHPDNDWYAEIDESSGMDWFGLELGVSINGQKTNLLPILLAALKDKYHAINLDNGEPEDEDIWYFPLSGAAKLALPAKRVWTMMKFLKDFYNFENIDQDGNLRLSRLEAVDLVELESVMKALELRWFGGEKMRKLGQKLKDFKGIEQVVPPINFKVDLREYQKDGLNWMQFLREYDLGGILADDMGLGKTIQALSYIMREKEYGRLNKPILVIAPTSVLFNWKMETERFTSDLKTLVLHGSERKKDLDSIHEYELILTTYPLLVRDKKHLLEQEFHTVILDEAQYIKNSKAKNTQIVCQLKADHRICMTGTPIENHLGELWSQFNFLLPGFLGDEKKFRQFFRNPIEKDGNMERNAALVRRIKPFILRRTKDQIAKELPPKTLIIRTASLDKAQRDLYETIRVSMQKKVRDEIAKKGLARSHIVLLEALLRLRQICCDPRLLKLDSAKKVTHSAKLEMLMEMLPEMIEEGRRILLFSQFVSMLQLIEDELNAKGIKYVKITGQTKDRAKPIEEFQSGNIPIFLISLKAGGTGLNLTAADTVIHYDPWWNPAAEEQATDRAHRIGQNKPVFVYKLITEGTVEEKILKMQEKKKALAEGIFNPDSKSAGKLTAEDINALFEPLG